MGNSGSSGGNGEEGHGIGGDKGLLLSETVEELNGKVEELNASIDKASSSNAEIMHLACQCEPGILWRMRCEVVATRTRRQDGAVLERRMMDFTQFHRLYWSVRGCFGTGNVRSDARGPFRVSDGLVACPEDDERVCAICMSERADVMLPCLHVFCNACISDWVKRSPHCDCPSCRAPLSTVKGGRDSEMWLVLDDDGDVVSYVWDEITRNSISVKFH